MRRRPLFPFLHNIDEPSGGGLPPAELTPTPPEAGTGEGAQAPGDQQNWENRYTDAQAWGTRLSQENATLKTDAELARALRSNDPTARQQALEALGFEFDDGGAGGEQLYDQVDPRVLSELEELKQWRDQTTSQQETEANYTAYRQIANPQMQQIGVPEGLQDVIAEAALSLPAVHTPQGQMPDIKGAWQQFEAMAEHFAAIPAVQSAVKKAWANTKPSAALTRPGGTDGTGVTAFENGDQRREWMLARMNANQ